MKVLLDACVPRPLRKFLPDYAVHTAQEMGWSQLKNGALLKEAESQFDAMITTDQNLTSPFRDNVYIAWDAAFGGSSGGGIRVGRSRNLSTI